MCGKVTEHHHRTFVLLLVLVLSMGHANGTFPSQHVSRDECLRMCASAHPLAHLLYPTLHDAEHSLSSAGRRVVLLFKCSDAGVWGTVVGPDCISQMPGRMVP